MLLRAVRSVLNQTYDNIEIIVVDDNEDQHKIDASFRTELETLGNVRYLTYPGNRGQSYSKNYGAKNAQGTYIGYLDDDDEYLPHKVQTRIFRTYRPRNRYTPFREPYGACHTERSSRP